MKARKSIKHLTRALRRELILRKVPHGLLGPAYLWPCVGGRTHLHRILWWTSGDRFPRLLWIGAQAWLWARWVLWHAYIACFRSITQKAPIVERMEGISCFLQTVRIVKLALLWCIPPHESYRFGLYRAPAKALDFLYDSETSAYHVWRSTALPFNSKAARLLQDKSETTALLQRSDIPVVATIAAGRRGANSPDLSDLTACHGQLFCKSNNGKGGHGAFAVWRTPEGIAGRTLQGVGLCGTAEVNAAWHKLTEHDTALIQPLLENHAALAALAFQQQAITVRYVSEQAVQEAGAPATWACLSATIEIPAGQTATGNTQYALLPLDPMTGAPLPSVHRPIARGGAREVVLTIEHAATSLSGLPYWSALADFSCRAHACFPGIRAIAWDWVITPRGPVLLEGNFGWGTAALQLDSGGLIARRIAEAARNG